MVKKMDLRFWYTSKKIVKKLKNSKNIISNKNLSIDLAMRYGNPSIKKALDNFKNNNINKLAIIPMFPQYSAATTASIFDKISSEIKLWRNIPDVKIFIYLS
jgi:ferrochelatase